MNACTPLEMLADAHGIVRCFRGLDGVDHRAGEPTLRAVLRAMGVDAETESDIKAALADVEKSAQRLAAPELVTPANRASSLPVAAACEWVLADEGGATLAEGRAEARITLPKLPVGVFCLSLKAGHRRQGVLVLSSPKTAPTVTSVTGKARIWGMTAALYGLRSSRNLGIGDYSDLAELVGAAAAGGASFVGINPVHLHGWKSPEISPYSPSHRGFLNPRHIACDAIPGLAASPRARALVEAAAAEVERGGDGVDYRAVDARLRRLLPELFQLFRQSADAQAQADCQAFVAEEGSDLRRVATFEALSEQHGPDWQEWPEHLRNPLTLPGDAADPQRVEFHAWLQWVAQRQLLEAGRAGNAPAGLFLDLAVGPRRSGAEPWMEQASLARGVSLGAPPDHLGPAGQNWQLAAYVPKAMAASGYRNFRHILRQSMRAAGILRIDHVLGLNRSYWVPDDGSPGAYVRQPFETLLALVKIEAHRAGCIVVGEDLGLVPPGFRETLQRHGLYGYSVLQYEKDENGAFRDAASLRAASLACFATHDTPTLAGFAKGRDIAWWQRLGWIDEARAAEMRAARRAECQSLAAGAESLSAAVHTRLAGSPVAMAAVQLDDVLGLADAQNLPGTTDEHPNWRRQYPVAVDDLGVLSALADTGAIMQSFGRAAGKSERESDDGDCDGRDNTDRGAEAGHFGPAQEDSGVHAAGLSGKLRAGDP